MYMCIKLLTDGKYFSNISTFLIYNHIQSELKEDLSHKVSGHLSCRVCDEREKKVGGRMGERQKEERIIRAFVSQQMKKGRIVT
jgi:hypothetical protein